MAGKGRNSLNATLAAHLAAGLTVRETAATAQCSERTVYRRLKSAKFRRAVSRLRARMVDSATGRLADGMSQASDTLRQLLADPDSTVRLRSSAKLIELAVRLRELNELEKRVDVLERLTQKGVR